VYHIHGICLIVFVEDGLRRIFRLDLLFLKMMSDFNETDPYL